MKQFLRALADWLLGPFEEKRDPGAPSGIRRGSMLRWTVFGFAASMCYRFIYRPPQPLSWQDVAIVALTLFAIPIAKAIDTNPRVALVALSHLLDRLPDFRASRDATPPEEAPPEDPEEEAA